MKGFNPWKESLLDYKVRLQKEKSRGKKKMAKSKVEKLLTALEKRKIVKQRKRAAFAKANPKLTALSKKLSAAENAFFRRAATGIKRGTKGAISFARSKKTKRELKGIAKFFKG